METNSCDIVIVTSGSVSSGPRVEKEADALSGAGFRVEVVASHTQEWMTEWDVVLTRSKRWSLTPTRRHAFGWEAATWFVSTLASKVSRKLGACPEIASSSAYLPLLKISRSKRARLYIAHNLGALPVAARLAARHGGLFAFDAEDDHFGELSKKAQSSTEGRIVRALEAKYLPGCAYVTASSEGIAQAIEARVGIAKPIAVHNVFPWSLRSGLDGQIRDRRGSALSLCWFSQTIGRDRGLQVMFKAAGQLRGDFQIHLRGAMDVAVEQEMRALIEANGLNGRVYFHPQVPPWELLSRIAEHDVGLALELPLNESRDRCVTNKLFFYLLSGLALVATSTRGQEGIAKRIPGTGSFFPIGDDAALAQVLQRFIDDPRELKRARERALEAARVRWNWEIESQVLLEKVNQVLGREVSDEREIPQRGSSAI